LHAALRLDQLGEGHLSYEQLAGCAEDKLPEFDRELAENHLAACADCATEVREVRALLPHVPVKQPAWARLKQWRWPEPHWRAAALTMGLLLLFGVLIGRGWRQQPAPEIAQVNPSPVVPMGAGGVDPSPTGGELPVKAELPYRAELLDNGQRVILDQAGRLSGLAGLPAEYERVVRETLARRRAPSAPLLDELAAKPLTLLSGEAAAKTFALLGPAGVVVLSDRPLFRWQPLPGAESYQVAVLDRDFNLLASSPQLSSASWRPARALPRQRQLQWQVMAKVGEREVVAPTAPQPEARFQILSRAEADELHRAARDFAGSHLLLGTLYARAGLLAEAEREFRALRAENPQAPLAQELLRSARARR
jgi:hypothetical protein